MASGNGEQGLDVFRLSSDKQFNIAKLLPGTVMSLKATTVKKESVDSMARPRRGLKVKNYVLKDRKHKRVYRAKPEGVGRTRAKYVLFVQKDNNLYYTPVELFKAAPEVVSKEEMSLEDAEEGELRRRQKFEMKLKSRKKVLSMLEKATEGEADTALALKARSRSAAGKATRDVGLGDEERDADFDDVFDDDEEAPVTIQIDAEPETKEEIQNEERIKHALKTSEEMEALSESDESEFEDDMDDIEQEASSSDDEVAKSGDSGKKAQSKKRQLAGDVEEDSAKRVKVESAASLSVAAAGSSSAAAAAATPAPPRRADGGVTEEDVRQQFETHGRLTAKSLASLLEDKWKYGGPNARQKLFTIVKRICKITEDSRRPGSKYLVLKQ